MFLRKHTSALKITALLLSVQVLPELFSYVGLDSSMSVGTAAATVIILVVFMATRVRSAAKYSKARWRIELGPVVFATTCVLLTLPHAAVANRFQQANVPRLLETLPLLFALLAGGVAFGRILLDAKDTDVANAVTVSFGFLCVSVFLRLTGLEPQAGVYEKPIFPFTEPSFFAIAFAPVLLYRCANTSGHARTAMLFFGFCVAFLIQSLTLIVGCILIAVACRRILIVACGALIFGIGVLPFELEYFSSRLLVSDETTNLSTLVFIQGWQLLVESLEKSFGWGIGFEQLGMQGTGVSAARAVAAITGMEGANLTDGSFVFAKLAGELGIFGILISATFLIAALQSIYALRRGRERPVVMFARSVLVCFVVDMFFRGPGYFTGSTLLAIAAAAVVFINRRRRLAFTDAPVQS
jgi:hypothetical protein